MHDAHARAVHEKWRDNKCPHCSSLFGRKDAMVRHCRVVHERRRDHQCPHCSSRFGEAGSMRRHCKTVHEKVRAHACIYCPEDVAFGTKSNLTVHLDTGDASSSAGGGVASLCGSLHAFEPS